MADVALLLAALVVTQAPWSSALDVRPKPTSLVVGEGAPEQTLVFPGKRPTTLRLRGPASVTLRVHGLMKKTPRKPEGPGRLSVRLGRGAPRPLELSGTPVEGWSVPKRPLFMVTRGATMTLEVPRGVAVITLQPSKEATVGFALGVAIEPKADVAGEAEPALAGLSDGAPEGGEVDEDEPQLVGNVEAERPLVRPRGFAVVAPVPAEVQVVSELHGEEPFYETGAHQTFSVAADGPGVITFDFHAHRDAGRGETLEPVVVGVLLDEVLVQTIAIEEAAAPEFRAQGRPYALSKRVALQLPVPSGTHVVTLSLSEEAALGASIRPRFDAIAVRESVTIVPPPAPEPPPEPVFQVAEAPPLRVEARPAPREPSSVAPARSVSASAAAGAWVPLGMGAVGGRIAVDAGLWLTRDVGIGFNAAHGWARYATTAADRRAADGTTHVRLDVRAVPLFIDVRYGVAVGAAWRLLAGAGAGGRLVWGVTRALEGRREEATSVTPIAVGHLGVTRALPRGALLLRLEHAIALESAARPMDRGETGVALGWTIGP